MTYVALRCSIVTSAPFFDFETEDRGNRGYVSLVPDGDRYAAAVLQTQLGAGHNGLAVAARLGALGVSTLVIDRAARVGDTWRKRYASPVSRCTRTRFMTVRTSPGRRL